jgi:hypothetical protein
MGKSWNQLGFSSVLGHTYGESNWREEGYKAAKRGSQGFYWHTARPKSARLLSDVRLVVTDLSAHVPYSYGEPNEIEIRYANHLVAKILVELAHIAEAIEESKSILDFEDNWDDEGAERIQYLTWLRAISFLESYAISAYKNFGVVIEKPDLTPGPEGSIDVIWKSASYRLLINISKEENQSALFYGDNYKDEKIKGSINPKEFNAGMLCFLGKIK